METWKVKKKTLSLISLKVRDFAPVKQEEGAFLKVTWKD